LNSLLDRVRPGVAARHVLITLPDRSRMADYTLVEMPDYYYKRVARTLGDEVLAPTSNPKEVLDRRVAALRPLDNKVLLAGAHATRAMISKIESRGGRVLFVAMPTSGMVREIDERNYPREQFWDRFVDIVGVPAVRSSDNPTLAGFTCPDGSHLDFRDRVQFTIAMARALGLSRQRTTPK